MTKVTPRVVPDITPGDDLTVKFTRIQGQHGGQSVTHDESEVKDIPDEDTIAYLYEDTRYTFELDTGYVREDDEVIGRDARAEVEDDDK